MPRLIGVCSSSTRIAGHGPVLATLGLLAVVVALLATPAGAAQAASSVRVEVVVWQHTADTGNISVGARPADGSWPAPEMLPLLLDDGVSSSGRYRYGDISIKVHWRVGAAPLTVDVRVWQHVEDERDIHISARGSLGSWRTLGTVPLALDARDGSDDCCHAGGVTIEAPLPEGATGAPLRYRLDPAGDAAEPGSYAFLTAPVAQEITTYEGLRHDAASVVIEVDENGEWTWTFYTEPLASAITTYEGLRRDAATLRVNAAAADGSVSDGLFGQVEVGHLVEWFHARDCFVRYRVTAVSEAGEDAPYREFGVRPETYVFQGCQSGSLPADETTVAFSAAPEMPLEHLGGTRLSASYGVVHGVWLFPGWVTVAGALDAREHRGTPHRGSARHRDHDLPRLLADRRIRGQSAHRQRFSGLRRDRQSRPRGLRHPRRAPTSAEAAVHGIGLGGDGRNREHRRQERGLSGFGDRHREPGYGERLHVQPLVGRLQLDEPYDHRHGHGERAHEVCDRHLHPAAVLGIGSGRYRRKRGHHRKERGLSGFGDRHREPGYDCGLHVQPLVRRLQLDEPHDHRHGHGECAREVRHRHLHPAPVHGIGRGRYRRKRGHWRQKRRLPGVGDRHREPGYDCGLHVQPLVGRLQFDEPYDHRHGYGECTHEVRHRHLHPAPVHGIGRGRYWWKREHQRKERSLPGVGDRHREPGHGERLYVQRLVGRLQLDEPHDHHHGHGDRTHEVRHGHLHPATVHGIGSGRYRRERGHHREERGLSGFGDRHREAEHGYGLHVQPLVGRLQLDEPYDHRHGYVNFTHEVRHGHLHPASVHAVGLGKWRRVCCNHLGQRHRRLRAFGHDPSYGK